MTDTKKSKLSLIIDGNWLLMSRLSVLNNRYADEYELIQELKLLMIKSMRSVLRTFPSIENIIFIADGGTWRNKIEIPACLHHDSNGDTVEYKGTRTKSDDFNWDLLFASYEEFMALLGSTGITVCRENGLEGDDWCYHWSKVLNEDGTNVIIWTKDKDLTQLVKMDKNKCFTVWYNKDNGLYVSDTQEDDINWFFNTEYNANEKIFTEICDKCPKITKVNPSAVIMEKIIKGDRSDNILPVAMRKYSSDKRYKISAKDIDWNLDYNDKDAVRNYFTRLFENKNYKGKTVCTLDEAIEHFNYNKRLVALEDSSFPEYVKEIFKKHLTYNVSSNISIAESRLQAGTNKLEDILDFV